MIQEVHFLVAFESISKGFHWNWSFAGGRKNNSFQE
jgi:hypothetical protein